jgi:hypothetical protein
MRPAHGDGRPRAGTAGDRGPAAGRQHPTGDRLADAPAGWRGGGRVEPAAAVSDLDDRPARAAGDDHFRLVGSGVPLDVTQRLADAGDELIRDRRRQRDRGELQQHGQVIGAGRDPL